MKGVYDLGRETLCNKNIMIQCLLHFQVPSLYGPIPLKNIAVLAFIQVYYLSVLLVCSP